MASDKNPSVLLIVLLVLDNIPPWRHGPEEMVLGLYPSSRFEELQQMRIVMAAVSLLAPMVRESQKNPWMVLVYNLCIYDLYIYIYLYIYIMDNEIEFQWDI